jgi:membrane fusion protein, multidrug efflux system
MHIRINKSYAIAGAVALTAVLWLAHSDIVTGGGKAVTPKVVKESAGRLLPVRVRASAAETITREVMVRGRTEALRHVELRSEIAGRVVELPVAKGGRVAPGAIVARLAPEDRAAQMAQAEAHMRQRQIEFDAAKSLAERGFRPEIKLAEAAALLDAAKAAVKRMHVDIDKLTIRAPFAGVIETLPAELGAFLKEGDQVARLVDEDPFLVVGQVTERDIGGLTLGQAGQAKLVTGATLNGRLRFIATTAEASTRTFRVELEVPNRERTMREGVTAELRLPVAGASAHRLTPAVLTLNDQGAVGVRAVDADNKVVFHPVAIVGDGPQGVWVTGLPDKVDIIVVGQEFVREGQQVSPSPAE